MSLSFVSSAILSSSDGISHNEEKPIESQEVTSLRLKQQQSKPLFEQLRANRDAEQEKNDEFTKEMRRGMRGLDEEDCAHLDTLEAMRLEREKGLKMGEEEEVAMWKASRAERKIAAVGDEEKETEEVREDMRRDPNDGDVGGGGEFLKVVPRIIGKKKRRQRKEEDSKTEGNSSDSRNEIQSLETKKRKGSDAAEQSKFDYSENCERSEKKEEEKEKDKTSEKNTKEENDDDSENIGLGGLLGCYGSGSEDSDGD